MICTSVTLIELVEKVSEIAQSLDSVRVVANTNVASVLPRNPQHCSTVAGAGNLDNVLSSDESTSLWQAVLFKVNFKSPG